MIAKQENLTCRCREAPARKCKNMSMSVVLVLKQKKGKKTIFIIPSFGQVKQNCSLEKQAATPLAGGRWRGSQENIKLWI
ncbi:hypothetical protein HAX54_042207 [Datura stramonium]|uniref:Uncharacterized protein n=1 Tax=Datura stramonium TaxID=4076 RepID=A0ABS8SLR4_DATST|nr:hypothetical protein [Datura stramonium]